MTLTAVPSILLRGVAILILLLSIIPRQWKETKIKDDLVWFRWSIFLSICIYTVSLLALESIRIAFYLTGLHNDIENQLFLVSAFGDFLTSVILYTMYSERIFFKKK